MTNVLGVVLLLLPFVAGAAERPELPQIDYPLADVKPAELRSQFNDRRGRRTHQAIDLLRQRGTPVMAVTDGVIRKLFRSRTGGISVYLFDGTEEYCFFYAHLDRYAKNLHEGQQVRRGEILGYVGRTGNATTPHLHFAVSLTGPERKWAGGVAIDPYPVLLAATAPARGDGATETAVNFDAVDSPR